MLNINLNRLLGIDELPLLAQKHLKKVLSFRMIISFLMSLSNTFYVIFVIDKVDFALAATVTSIMLFTQLLLDYPSGTLGDWLGQRWVLTIAFSCYSLNFFLLMQDPSVFEQFVVIGIINGIGNAQSSGAIETWVDNNYRKVISDKDPDRKIYGFAQSRMNSFQNIALGSSFLIGGVLATLYSRVYVFTIQFFLSLIVVFLIFLFVKDIKMDEEENITKDKRDLKREYITFLSGGIKFVFSSKSVSLFIIGLSISNVTWLIWGNLILFPIYFGYTGSDVFASTLRTTLFFVGIPIGYFMANISKKLSNKRFTTTLLLEIIVFFPSMIILTSLVPVTNEFNPLGIIWTFLLMVILVGFLFDIDFILSQRILLDLIPSENRNAVYSLLPSVVSLLGIPILPLTGLAVETYGLPIGIAIAMVVSIIGFVLIREGMKDKKIHNAVEENFLKASTNIGD